jgi:2-methylcitrate dehydratase
VAARHLGLDRAHAANAVSLALTPNLALGVTRRGKLAMWKGCASGNAARNGLFAALLAQAGMTGPDRPFEGKKGLKDLLAGGDLGALVPDGEPLAVTQADVKFYVTEFHSEAPIMMALSLARELDVGDIASITIDTYKFAYEEIGSGPEKWRPTTRETADHGMPYVAAAVLVDGHFSDGIFEPARFTDPRILSLADKIVIREDPELTRQNPQRFPCRMEIRLKDGAVRKAAMPYPRGHHDDPMSDDEVSGKFRLLASGKLAPAQVERVLDCLWRLDQAPSIGELFDLVEIA